MKYLFLVLPLALAACGSADKKEAKEEAQKVEAKADKAKKDMKKKVQVSGDFSCQLGEDKRKLEVVKSESGCALQYTKSGVSNEVASGGVGSEHCQNVANKIKGKLEEAGFKCE